MKIFYLKILILIFAGEINKCPPGFELIESKCFFYSNDKLNWNNSKKSCERKGAHLAVPTNEKELDFIKNKQENVWIGAKQEKFLLSKLSNSI